MTERVILDDIPFELDTEQLLKKMRLKAGSEYADEALHLAAQGQAIGRPKALYRSAYVESRGEDWVVVDGVRFTSHVLRVNLEKAYRVFLYVATGGLELEHWTGSCADMLQHFWADAISEMALRSALKALREHLAAHFRPGQTAHMSPGSLPDWPIQEQRPLFSLLGDTRDAVGVRLTDSLLMVPIKSVSGIHFPSEESWESCQLCPREDCPGRRAPYEPGLLDRAYG